MKTQPDRRYAIGAISGLAISPSARWPAQSVVGNRGCASVSAAVVRQRLHVDQAYYRIHSFIGKTTSTDLTRVESVTVSGCAASSSNDSSRSLMCA